MATASPSRQVRAKLVHAQAVLETLRRRVETGPTAMEWQKGYVKALEEIFDLEEILPGILFIVARDRLALYEYLVEQAARQARMQVILDRRWGERRQRIQVHVPERRRAARRRQPISEDDLRSYGFVILPQE